MKKNNICNYDMDLAILTANFDEAKKEKNDNPVVNDVKLMVRRRHTVEEKKKAQAKWRADFTGKKHHKDRTREDYKDAKEMNEEKRSFRFYIRGGYDRHGIIQNRRNIEATKDALEDIVYDDEIQYEVDQYVRLIEAKDYYENLVNRLQKERDIINFMYSTFSRKMETEGVANNFLYTPTVEIDSYAFEALGEAKADLAEVESELEWVRKSGYVPSLLTDDGRIYQVEDNDDYWYEEEDEEFEYYRYFDSEIGDHVTKKFRRR